MTNVKPLSPYLAAANRQRLGGVPSANPLMRYSMNKKDPKDLIGEIGGGQMSPRIESMDEASVCNSIPITKF